MIPGLLISNIISAWKAPLVSSQSITEFCQTKYGKDLKILVGVDPNARPSDSDCPYVVIYPGWKIEGTDRRQYRYTVPVTWAIINSTKTTVGNVTELAGIYECDQLGQLILAEITAASPANPVAYVKYWSLTEESMEALNYFPKFEGGMEVKIYVPPVMGGKMTY